MVGSEVWYVSPRVRRIERSGGPRACAAAGQARPSGQSCTAEAKSASAQKKPFSMSYDGVTQADYITYMIARGTR